MITLWIWFSLLEGISLKNKRKLLAHYGTPDRLYALDADGIAYAPVPCPQVLDKDLARAEKVLQDCAKYQIGILTIQDSGYPSLLRRVEDAPIVLYYRGTLPNWDIQPVIGVVGTRHASPYGLKITQQISAEIAACGGIVVSGGAFGVDAQAARGALSQGKITVAVMACGLNRPQPTANKELFEEIMGCGCLISEYPPFTEVFKGNFLRRNRIISGISNGILVAEAPIGSGALNTAQWAQKQERELYAVPGDIDKEYCAGSNQLIADGATAALTGWQVLQPYADRYRLTVRKTQPTPAQTDVLPQKNHPKAKADKINIDKQADSPYSGKDVTHTLLNEKEKALVTQLSAEPIPIDILIERLDMPLPQVLSLITTLTVRGVVKSHPGRLISLN